jgi:mannose-6-phosphate isomerase-like protein (cupin superfamily)
MNFAVNADRDSVFDQVRLDMEQQGFHIVQQDRTRPWGGFFVLDESQAPKFIETFFPHLSMADFAGFEKLSPKILMVAPHKRLSWQYHFRRAEIWKVIGGHAGVVVSDTDEETPVRQLAVGTTISLKQGERHRLVGLEEWGVIAEIWQHIDREHPSDESDIVRLQDDFGR